MKLSYAPTLFAKAASELGLHPFPRPSANMSQRLHQPATACSMAPCTYCGFCEWFGCGNYSKSSAADHAPAGAAAQAELQAAHRMRGDCRSTSTPTASARPASPMSIAKGDEFEQPADLVLLCAYSLHNVHLLLLSGIGKPYDPATGKGVVGRNYAYQITLGVDVLLRRQACSTRSWARARSAMAIDEYNGDNFDHGPHGFIGGGYIACGTPTAGRSRPARRRDGTPNWGGEWKKAVANNYQRAIVDRHPRQRHELSRQLPRPRSDLPRRLGRPAAADDVRLHRQRAQDVATSSPTRRRDRQGDEAARDQGQATAQGTTRHRALPDHAQHRRRDHGHRPADQRASTAICRAGMCRTCSSWARRRFPQNAGYNPTGTVGALTYWGLDAILNYVKSPGALVRP